VPELVFGLVLVVTEDVGTHWLFALGSVFAGQVAVVSSVQDTRLNASASGKSADVLRIVVLRDIIPSILFNFGETMIQGRGGQRIRRKLSSVKYAYRVMFF